MPNVFKTKHVGLQSAQSNVYVNSTELVLENYTSPPPPAQLT